MVLFHGFGGPPWHGHGGKRGGWFMQPPIWGFLQPCLLLLLQEGPKHGYRLIEELAQRQLLGGGVDIGHLYRTLHKMEMMGLVELSGTERGNGPNKRIYQITEHGRELLKGWATMLEQHTSTINRFLNEYHRVFGEDSTQPQAASYSPDFSAENDNDFI